MYCLAKKEEEKVISVICYCDTFEQIRQQYENILKAGIANFCAYSGYDRNKPLFEQRLQKVRFRGKNLVNLINSVKERAKREQERQIKIHQTLQQRKERLEVENKHLREELKKKQQQIRVQSEQEKVRIKTPTLSVPNENKTDISKYVKDNQTVKKSSVWFYRLNFLEPTLKPTISKIPWPIDYDKNQYRIIQESIYSKKKDITITLYAENDEEAIKKASKILNDYLIKI